MAPTVLNYPRKEPALIPTVCHYTPIAMEVQESAHWEIAIRFEPGCNVCKTYTCTPITMAELEEYRRDVYAAINKACSFCSKNDVECLFMKRGGGGIADTPKSYDQATDETPTQIVPEYISERQLNQENGIYYYCAICERRPLEICHLFHSKKIVNGHEAE